MKTKLFLFTTLIGLCAVVYAKQPMSGKQSYHQFLMQKESLEDFHRSQKSKSNPDQIHVVTYGGISGTVYESDGVTPIQDAWIDVYTLDEESCGGGSTNTLGEYFIDWIPSGSCHVLASGYIVEHGDLYITEYYHNQSNWTSADQVAVTAPNTTTGINFTLTEVGYQLYTYLDPSWAGTLQRNPDKLVYEPNEVVIISVTDIYPGYCFDYWSGDASGSDNPLEIIMDRDKNITAKFGHFLETWVHPQGVGSITRDPDEDIYDHNQVVVLTANPPVGYGFKRWDGHIDSNSNPEEILMDNNKEVIAVFDILVELTMQVDPLIGGTTIPEPGTYSYVKGSEVEIEAVPETGYRFVKWNCNVADPSNPNTVVYMLGDETVTAKFKPITCTLTIQANPPEGGTTNPVPGKHTYDQSEVVQISADSEESYRFVNWTGDVASSNNPTTHVTMNNSKTVKANFEKIQYVLTMEIDPEEGGEVDPEIGEHVYEAGELIEIIAVASDGYHFMTWTGYVAGPDSSMTTVTMDQNQTVRANFKKLDAILTIRVNPEEGGTTEPIPGEHVYKIGEDVELAAIAEEGFRFTGWIGGVLNSDSSITTVKMEQSKEVQANFEWNIVTLTIYVKPDNAGRTEPEVGKYTYERSTLVDIHAVSKKVGYHFSNWTGKVIEPDSAHTTVLMDSSKTIIAHFSVADKDPPELKNCYPYPKAQAVPKNTKVKFKVKDKETGIVLNTLNVWVNELKILENGIDLTTGNTDLLPSAQACKVIYQPEKVFEDDIPVNVHITCYDFGIPPNLCDTTYSFTIGTAKIDTSTSNVIDQTGGIVSDSTSGVEIIIPFDAVDDTVEITIDHIQNPPPLPEGVTGVAVPYHFGPDGLEFHESVVVQIPYTQSNLDSTGVTDPMKLRLFYFHSLSGEWTELEIDSVDAINSFLYITITEFCYFSMGTEKQSTLVKNTEILDQTTPSSFKLSQNYPNPFNPETTILWKIPEDCRVLLEVYNTKGQLISTLFDAEKPAGTYISVWKAHDDRGLPVPTGIYLFRLRAGNHVFVRKASYVK